MNILITGANGYLGGKIIWQILESTGFDIIAVASSEEKVATMCERENIDKSRVFFLSNMDFFNPDTKLNGVYGAVHLAFARRIRPATEIASSLSFAAAVFHKLANCNIDRVINVSSQGVYGATEAYRTEDTIPAPDNNYTMAKYASEVLFNDIMKNCAHYTNIRLDLVAQSQNVIKGLCTSAKKGIINLTGGKQVFSFIDAKDVATAIIAMLNAEGKWDAVYNVGWSHKRYNLLELAHIVADASVECGYKRPLIELTESDAALWSGMDSSRFMKKTGWEPKIEIESTVKELLQS